MCTEKCLEAFECKALVNDIMYLHAYRPPSMMHSHIHLCDKI